MPEMMVGTTRPSTSSHSAALKTICASRLWVRPDPANTCAVTAIPVLAKVVRQIADQDPRRQLTKGRPNAQFPGAYATKQCKGAKVYQLSIIRWVNGDANPVWATWAIGTKGGKTYILSDMQDKTFIVRYVMGNSTSIFYG